MRRSFRDWFSALFMGCTMLASGPTVAFAAEIVSLRSHVIEAVVHPAIPDDLSKRGVEVARAVRTPRGVTLSNGFLAVEIGAGDGMILAVENKLTGERSDLADDQAGFSFTDNAGRQVAWQARAGLEQRFDVEIGDAGDRGANVVFVTRSGDGSAQIKLHYQLGRGRFWIERRLSVETGPVTYDTLTYGAMRARKGEVRELKLGKFDAPRLVTVGKGGLFAGVGWWFYEIADGVYRNSGMSYATTGRFEAEPWYVGVFQSEPGEPYAGWLWYKTFVSERKLAHDKQPAYNLWNARSGYDFRPISDPNILDYIGTAQAIGLDGITAGVVRGVGPESERAATDPTARRVVDAFTSKGIDFGLHEGAVDAKRWETEEAFKAKLEEIAKAKDQGIRQLSVDFLKIEDRFADHRRVTAFFRKIRTAMDYTECHLGMAAYGPQFQREVLINHPTDLHGFDIARFSSDWATFTGFRHSRREWQKRYAYLMPENGLFYFATHYSNYPRRYEEPEPQQFLFQAHAWRGLAYAFHDKIGFRDSLAAQAAFSTFYIFGHLDAAMPEADRTFARDYLAWVKDNATVVSRGRAEFESEDALVMSKVRDGRGAIFALNYTPGAKRFRITLDITPDTRISVRQIYPERRPALRIANGDFIETDIAGERLAIFEVNDGLQGLPPVNPREFPVDVTGWRAAAGGHEASFVMPDVRAQLATQADPTLPRRIVIADQTETEYLRNKSAGRTLGKPAPEFLAAYGFKEDMTLDTWKAAPWAFADRVWLVYRPKVQPTITAPAPVLRLNGREITMSPRIQYDPRNKNASEWTVALWFADVTELCTYGATNQVVLTGTKDAEPGDCYIASGVPATSAARQTFH